MRENKNPSGKIKKEKERGKGGGGERDSRKKCSGISTASTANGNADKRGLFGSYLSSYPDNSSVPPPGGGCSARCARAAFGFGNNQEEKAN